MTDKTLGEISDDDLMRLIRERMGNAKAPAPEPGRPGEGAVTSWAKSIVPSTLSLGGGIYQGFRDVTNSAVQMGAEGAHGLGLIGDERLGNVQRAVRENNADFAGAYPNNAPASVGRFAGQVGGTVAATAPLAAPLGSGLVRQMEHGGAQGALSAALLSSTNDRPLYEQTGIGGVLGMAAPPVMRLTSALLGPAVSATTNAFDRGRRLVDRVTSGASGVMEDLAGIRTALESGNEQQRQLARQALEAQLARDLENRGAVQWRELMPDAQGSMLRDAEASLRATGRISPEVLQRTADFRALGMEGTLGASTRDPRLWQFEQNTSGVPGRAGQLLTDRFVADNQALTRSARDLASRTGGQAGTPYGAGDRARQELLKKYDEMQAEVGGMYNDIRRSVGEQTGMRPERLLTMLDDLADEAASEPVVSSVRNRLKRLGGMPSKEEPKALVLGADGKPLVTSEAPGGKLTVTQAEELRKFIGRLSDGNDPSVQRIKKELVDALDDDVFATRGADAFAAARAKARERFSMYGARPLKALTEGKLVEDKIVGNITSMPVRDLEAWKNAMLSASPAGPSQGGAAWNDLRRQVLEGAIDSATASGKFLGRKFSDALDKIGPERLMILFSPQEVAQLETIRRAAWNTTVEVPFSRVNYSGTGAMLADLMQRMGLGQSIAKGANAATNVPVVGPLLSPVTGVVRMAGEQMDRAATESAVRKVLGNTPLDVERAMTSAEGRRKIAELLQRLPAPQAAAAGVNLAR